MEDHQSDKQQRKEEEEEEEESQMKSCTQCGATRTPLWRNGPAGPKSLCNACGIKSRKKRGSPILGGTKSSTEEKKSKKLIITNSESSASTSSNGDNYCKPSQVPKEKLVPRGQEVVFQKSIAERLRRRLGEDEKAAMLLLNLSCGSVY